MYIIQKVNISEELPFIKTTMILVIQILFFPNQIYSVNAYLIFIRDNSISLNILNMLKYFMV